jgi:hypothetical protein
MLAVSPSSAALLCSGCFSVVSFDILESLPLPFLLRLAGGTGGMWLGIIKIHAELGEENTLARHARRSQKVAGHRRRGLKRRLNKHRCLISYLVMRSPEAALQGVVFWRTVVDDHSALAL